MTLTEQYSALHALESVAKKLQKAGATFPVENHGTIESAMNTGLSIALVVLNEEIELWQSRVVS